MKTLKFLFLFTAIFSMVLVTSCQKDKETEPEPTPTSVPDYHIKTVELPEAMVNSNDLGAQTAMTYVNMVNGLSGFGAMMIPPSKSTDAMHYKDGTEVYTWEINEEGIHCTFTLKITETSDMYKWELIINGTMDNISYSNFVYIYAEEKKDGSWGEITIYNPEQQGNSILFLLTWHNSDGSMYLDLEIPETFLIKLVTHEDQSGSVEMSDWENNQWVLSFKAQWDASGHGQWWDYYDESEGSW